MKIRRLKRPSGFFIILSLNWIFPKGLGLASRIILSPKRSAPVLLGKRLVSLVTGMKAVTAIDMVSIELNIKNIDIVGLWKQTVIPVICEYIPEDLIIVITDCGMKFLSAYTIFTIIGMNVVRIEFGSATSTVIFGILKEFLARYKRPDEHPTPII